MKRQLLSLLFVAFAFVAFGQNSGQNLVIKSAKEEILLDKGTPVMHNNSFPAPPKTGVTPIGTSYNVYSILRDAQNQVSYNPDLDAVAFVHRQNAGLPGGSGLLSFDISTDGGATWDTTTKVVTPEVTTDPLFNGARYPSGVIWNPAGNTDPNNAKMITSGPMLTSYTGSWGMVFLTDSKFDGTSLNSQYFANADTTSLIPAGMVINPNGDMFITDIGNSGRYEIEVYKYTYDGTSSFNVSSQILTLDTAGLVDPFMYSQTNMGFAPDGMTGYVVAVAEDTFYSNNNLKFHTWKTTDGGATWNHMPPLDFTTIPGLLDVTIPTSVDTSRRVPWPYFGYFDMVVDSLGECHIISVMGSYSDPEGGTIWTGGFASQTVWRYQTDGTNWSGSMLDEWNNTWGDIAGDGTSWFGPRPQAARTADGSAIFLNWTKTDTLSWFTTSNIAPDVWSYGKGIGADGKDTIKDLTNGTEAFGACTWATIAPVMMETGADFDFEFAMVYGEHSGAALNPIQYYFAKGFGFDKTELFNNVISTKPTTELQANINIFPNPTSGALNIDLNELENAVNIDIVNMMGQTVRSLTEQRNLVSVDMSAFSNGVYLVRFTDGAKTTTRKVVLSK